MLLKKHKKCRKKRLRTLTRMVCHIQVLISRGSLPRSYNTSKFRIHIRCYLVSDPQPSADFNLIPPPFMADIFTTSILLKHSNILIRVRTTTVLSQNGQYQIVPPFSWGTVDTSASCGFDCSITNMTSPSSCVMPGDHFPGALRTRC